METTLAVQSIPITKIKPSSHNPRHVIHPNAVDTLAASLHAVGQETPIKVRLLAPEERVFSVDFEYEVIGGHLRLEAAKKLGWGTLYGIVLSLTPSQAELAAILDNQGEDMHWLDWYQAIERRLADPSKPTQQQVADELGVSQQLVSQAAKILKVLNPTSRDLIYQSLVKTEGEYQVSASSALRLTNLEDPQLIEKALAEVIKNQMTEPQVTSMVVAIKNGLYPGLKGEAKNSQPETSSQEGEKPGIPTLQNASIGSDPQNDGKYDMVKVSLNDSGKPKIANDPFVKYWAGLPKEVQVTQTRKGYKVVMNLAPNEAVPVVYGALSNWEYLKGQAGEDENLRYRNVLPQVHKEAVEKRKLEARNEESGIKNKIKQPGIAAAQPMPTLREPQGPEQSRRVGAEPRHDSKSGAGLLGSVKKALGEELKDAPSAIEDNLAKDAKQAANYQIRRVMRTFLRNLFN